MFVRWKEKNKIQKSRPYKVLSKPPDGVHDVNLRAVKMWWGWITIETANLASIQITTLKMNELQLWNYISNY